MEGSFLSPQEQKYYSELFTRYDVEKTGKLSNSQAMVLFLSSDVPNNTLKQITANFRMDGSGSIMRDADVFRLLRMESNHFCIYQISDLCGAERVGHYGRSQFFIALKLIALVQSGKPLPASLDGLSSGLELPLPVFGENVNDIEAPDRMEFENPGFIGNAPDADIPRLNGSGFPPPPQKTRAGITSKNNLQSIDEQDGSSPQEYSPSSSPPASPEPLLPPHSPLLSSPSHESASAVGGTRQSGLPVASTPRAKPSEGTARLEKEVGGALPLTIGEEGWAHFEEARSKASSDMNNSWATFPKTSEVEENHSDSNKVVKAEEGTNEEEDEDDPWVITKEQKKYYTTQFQTLQPDLNSSITGPDAKAFFEKSKLPTYELSQIWQLSDVNKDGTLYLEEFCTAMHLVVLRKHDIKLPERLPTSLIPKIGHSEATMQPEPVLPSSTVVITPLNSRKHSGRSVTPPSSESEVKPDENWATFQDSPFPGPPSPSSQTPVNFDFASISPDPDAGIFQPKPVHLAPDGKPLADDEHSQERPRTFSDPLQLERREDQTVAQSPAKVRSLTHADTIDSTPTKIAPPPSTQKHRASKQIHSEGQAEVHDVTPPPPRSRSRSYTGPTLRSQLNQLKSQTLTPLRLSRQQALTEESEGNRSLPAGAIEPIEPISPLAPAPPPRKSGHNRTASLDLDTLDKVSADSGRPSRPLVPPRPSAQIQEVNVQYLHTSKRALSMEERPLPRTDNLHEIRPHDGTIAEINEKEGPPQLPPRPVLPEESHPDTSPSKQSERHHSADLEKEEDDKKDRRRHVSAPASSSKKPKAKDRRTIQAAIRAAKEDNAKLSRLNNELHQELSQLTEDRVGLEVQLHKLRPFHKINSS